MFLIQKSIVGKWKRRLKYEIFKKKHILNNSNFTMKKALQQIAEDKADYRAIEVCT